MAQFHGKAGTVTYNSAAIGIGAWQLDTNGDVETETSVAEWKKFSEGIKEWTGTFSGMFEDNGTLRQLFLHIIKATVVLPAVGKVELNGFCSPEHTRAYFPSTVYENKYFLMHLNEAEMSLRREKVVYDLAEAQAWVWGE